jgi:hypothetical protein
MQRTNAPVDRLHGQNLWSDYLRIPPLDLPKIVSRHPNRDRRVQWDGDGLFRYLDGYNDLSVPIMLQTNRLHHELGLVADRYDARLIHVIRNPMSVFYSIRRSYFSSVGLARRLARVVSYPFFGGRAFETNGFAERAIRNAGLKPPLASHFGLLARFVPAWVQANVAAIRAVRERGGTIVVYEKLVREPVETAAALREYLGIPVRIDPGLVRESCETSTRRDSQVWRKLVDKWDMGIHVAEIAKTVDEQGGRWT